MLIVDDKVNSDFEDVFKEYNWPHKPVRVFAYSIAGGKSKESELKTIACNNKGAYRRLACWLALSQPLYCMGQTRLR